MSPTVLTWILVLSVTGPTLGEEVALGKCELWDSNAIWCSADIKELPETGGRRLWAEAKVAHLEKSGRKSEKTLTNCEHTVFNTVFNAAARVSSWFASDQFKWGPDGRGDQCSNVSKEVKDGNSNVLKVKDDPLTLFTWEDEVGGKRTKREAEEEKVTSKVGLKLQNPFQSYINFNSALRQNRCSWCKRHEDRALPEQVKNIK